MVTISSCSNRTNFLNFKHSVSELPILILCCSLPKWLFFFSFLEEGAKNSNTVFENDTLYLALLCMLTTSMLLSCFGFIVIVRHSMQVYNYFLIKIQCVLCFYKWGPLVWLSGEVGGPSSPRVACQRSRLWFHGATSASCILGTKKAVLAGGADLWQAVPNASFGHVVSSCRG